MSLHVLIPANGFQQQIDEFTKQLGYLSDVVEVGDDAGASVRNTSFLVEIPDGSTGVTTTLDYRESYRKVAIGWLRVSYAFEVRVTKPRLTALHSRKAHHKHHPWDVHQHCETPTSRDDHFLDVERLAQATQIFVTRLAAGTPVDCSGLIRIPQPR